MSNRRKPERRDAHGAPIRSRREIWIAVATGLAVLAVSVILIVIFRHRPPEAPKIPAPTATSTPAPGADSTSSTSPPGTAAASDPTTTTAPAATSTSSQP